MTKPTLFLCTLLLFVSCGKKDTYIHNESVSQGEQDRDEQEQSQEVTTDEDLTLLYPKDQRLTSNYFVAKGEALPDTDKSFLKIKIQKSNIKNLNGLEFKSGTREIEFFGKKIVFDDQDTQGILKLVKDQRDISKITINAETVDISTPLTIPGTNLTINSKSLIFSSGGKITLTPLKNISSPGESKNGESGQSGGHLVLNIEELSHPNLDRPLFVLKGADGQEAGQGKNGQKGIDRTVIDSGGVIYKPTYNYRGCYNNLPSCTIALAKVEGIPDWPTNGGDAIKGGKPGLPGNGGKVTSSIQIERRLFNLGGGKSGEPAPNYNGGAAGTPNPAVHQRINFNEFQYVPYPGERTVRHFSNGKDAISPGIEKEIGEEGDLSLDQKLNWLNIGYLEMGLKYAKELYINNHFQVAKNELSKIQASCETISQKELEVLNSDVFCSEAASLLFRINSNLDYFSKELAWIPSLSLESNFKIYQTEISSAFKSLYLAEKVTRILENTDDAIRAVKKAKSEAVAEIDRNLVKQKDLVRALPNLQIRVAEVKKQQSIMIKELEKFEEDIKLEAERNVEFRNRVPFLKKAVNTMVAISKVIPAGNPLFTNISSSLSRIVDVGIGNMRWQDWIKTFPDDLENFSPEKVKRNVRDWNQFREKIDLGTYEQIARQRVNPEDPNSPTEESIKRDKWNYFKNLKSLLFPVGKEIFELSRDKGVATVPKNEIDKEIERLQSLHPIFKPLSQKLKQLVNDKEKLIRELNSFRDSMQALSVENAKLFLRTTELTDSHVNLQEKEDPYLMSLMRDSERSAKEKLEKYNYYFYKAYYYRMLTPFPGTINLVPVYEKIRDLVVVGDESDFNPDVIESIQAIHTEQVSKVVKKLTVDLNNGGFTTIRSTRVYKLNPVELKMLNNGSTIYLNLLKEEILGKDFNEDVFENLRIDGVSILEMDYDFDIDYLRYGEGTLTVSHEGESYFKKNDNFYKFKLSDNPFVWRKTKDFGTGTVDVDEENGRINSERSILSTILDNERDRRLLFARAGGIGSLRVNLSKRHNPEVKVDLVNAVLKITFESELK